jgi:hypothetical protein
MPFSGGAWTAQFPNSTSIDDLVEPFRTSVRNFLAALKTAGASVTVSSPLRPPQRAHLMHYSFLISSSAVDPSVVPAYAGVDIQWVHLDTQGKPDSAASRNAAREMVVGYEIVYAPALKSKHTLGQAIDMDIEWKNNLQIADAHGKSVVISTLPRTGGNLQLQSVGASYGVIKLASDPPHWSIDGH